MHPNATEHSEQVALIAMCDLQGYPYNMIFAIPNGGARHPVVASKMKAEGVRRGVPDLFLPLPRLASGHDGEYHGLFIELKVRSNKPSPEQIEMMRSLGEEGYRVEVCYGCDAAWQVIKNYVEFGI